VYLPDIDYYAPESISEACELLARLGSGAKVIAGGTDVLSKMKQEMLVTQAFVSLKNIRQLGNIEFVEGRGVVIGAKATHNDLVDSPILQGKYPAICETAHSMANLQVRNRGTIGGNIVNAVPSADLPPILIALGATVTLVGTAGERTLLLEDFFVGPGQTVIGPDEILIEIVVPNQSVTGSSYLKFGLRHSGALAVVGVAAAVTLQNGIIEDARIVLGAVAPVPMRAREAEDVLTGRMASEELLEEAGKRASRECRPISDIRGSEEYRRDMVKVFTKRALRKALYGNISEEDGGHHNADYDG
jgi:carbon-monoxide dehydrogenase medium subunit